MSGWTEFYDLCSGGKQKLAWRQIFIQASMPEAMVIFFNVFGRHAGNITCSCCGPDYWITEHESLDETTELARAQGMVRVIHDNDISAEDRAGSLSSVIDEWYNREDSECVTRDWRGGG